MSLSFRGYGVSYGSTGAISPDWVAGASGDPIVAQIANKPYSDTVSTTDGTFTEIATATSGTVANGVDTGSTRATVAVKKANDTGTGSVTYSAANMSPIMGVCARFGTTTGRFLATGIGLADTSETLQTVSATGSVAAGQVASGDMVAICVAIKSDSVTHTSQTLTIPGCTVGAITWAAPLQTSQGNDGTTYWGYATITAGSSNGSNATYGATSSTIGASAAAVTVLCIRELPAASYPSGVRDRRIRRNSLLRR